MKLSATVPAERFRTLKQVRGIPAFALVITLSLMVLLMVVAVGLLSLSSISLRQSTAASNMSVARENARLGLLLALGELQRHAGPDQRVTAPADIAGDATGQAIASGQNPGNNSTVTGANKGLSPLQPGTRFWTGVWSNASTNASQVFTRTPAPKLEQWLVSGNYGSFDPASAITPASANIGLKPDGSVTDAKQAVVLAGLNTVGAPTTENLERYVAAPVMTIERADPNASAPAGRYAWWIGDEGTKAKINLPTTLDDGTRYAALSAQRRGWETVAGFDTYPNPSSGLQASIPKVVTMPAARLLLPAAGDTSTGISPLQAVFHAATADSMGVLADTLNGGTRVDLTAILASDLPSSNPLPAITNYPVKNTNIIPRAVARSMRAPKWDALKEFHDRYRNLNGGALLVKVAKSETEASVAPLITDFRILMGIKFVPVDANFKANPCGKIAIALANPYSVPLKWDKDLEIEVRNQTPRGNRPSRIWNLGANSVYIPDSDNPAEPAVFNNAIFRIRSATLAPGEARAYTQSGAIKRDRTNSRAVIDLAHFPAAGAPSFSNCVELETTGTYSTFPNLDVRESWQTTLVMVEMRLAGNSAGSQPLRRLERFELDNGYFSPNTLRGTELTPEELRRLREPVPLMLYSFQVSQPGVDYKSLMPSPYVMGQRASTLRTFADFNLQATRVSKPIASYNPPPYFMESNDSLALLGREPGFTGTGFTRNLAVSPLAWGRSSSGSAKTILFSVPQQVTSLAQFQHADLTGDDLAASIGHQPGNAFGNSYATPFVKRSLTVQNRTDYELIGTPNHSGANQTPRNYYDISYLLNASLWDSFFLSTIPYGAPQSGPENPSLVTYNAAGAATDLTDPVNCASRLMIDGAFNVNSTDKNAWKAFLASSKYFKHPAEGGDNPNAAFPRSLEQPTAAATPPSGTDADSFSGYRRLSDEEIDALATEMVKQVRLRGPFLSLSHFLNRALGDVTRQGALTRSGTLQSAIDEAGINANFAGTKVGFKGRSFRVAEDRVTLAWIENAPGADLDGQDRADRPTSVDSANPDWAARSTDNNFGAVASIIADRPMLSESRYRNEQGYRSTGIPGWLTQADVLQVIGPSISSRSDTFRIRAYGEAVDANGNTVAKAWCEAIVQRVPAYVDPANAPSVRGTDLTTLNKTYGRQFKIASFRWLSPQEI